VSTDTKAIDPYEILGVPRTTSDAEIKKAYRALAKKLHPDLTPGDQELEERFKAVSAAYDFLKNSEQRRRFDAGEIDATGAERPERTYYRHYADAGERHRYGPEGGSGDFSDFFARTFGHGGDRVGARMDSGPMRFRGGDLRYHLAIGFLDAVNGATRRVTSPDGSVLDITIPPGTRDGQVLRLAGRGQPGLNDGPPGNALIEISVAPHPVFKRDGNDIHLDLPIAIDEAVLGGSVDVPTRSGRVKLRIPKGSSTGKVLRLKGKGVRPRKGVAGDQLVTVRIVLPDTVDEALETAMETWRENQAYDPRTNWKGRVQ
jgi:DnaJ-class molecular chaperone